MNSGDLQYASGSVAIAGNLFVGGTVTAAGGGGGVSSVTGAVGASPTQPTIVCSPTTGAVIVSYVAASLGSGSPSGVPVNSMYTPDTAVFPQVGAAPLSGNILVTGGQTLLGGTLPRGAIVCATKSGTTLSGAPSNVAGTLEITNVGIAGVIADSKVFTGTAVTGDLPAAPGYVEFTSPNPGMTVRSTYLNGAVGSGIVEVSNVGVTSLAIKDSTADPLVGDVLVSSSSGISLSYTSTPGSTTYPSGLWNTTQLYKHGDHAGQEFSLGNFIWSLCLTDNVNYPPKDNSPPTYEPKWEPVAYWTSTLPYVGAGIFTTYLPPGATIPLLYRSLQFATGVVPTATAYWAIDGTPGIPSTSTQVIEISNTGVLSAVAATGIGVGSTGTDGTGTVTIYNTGVLSLQSSSPPDGGGAPVSGETLIGPVVMSASDGSGIGILTSTVGPFKVCAFANTGVRSAVAGTGIDVSGGAGGTGAVTISNTGVLSVTPSVVAGQLGITTSTDLGVVTVGYQVPRPVAGTLPTSYGGLGTGLGSWTFPYLPDSAATWETTGSIPIGSILHLSSFNSSTQLGCIQAPAAATNFAIIFGNLPGDATYAVNDLSVISLTDSNQGQVYPESVQITFIREVGTITSYTAFLVTLSASLNAYKGFYSIHL